MLDSQNFLVRHRRNRVYGVAAVNTGSQSEEEFDGSFRGALTAMMTHCHFSMNDSFDLHLSQEPVHLHRVQKKLDEALEEAAKVAFLKTALYTWTTVLIYPYYS